MLANSFRSYMATNKDDCSKRYHGLVPPKRSHHSQRGKYVDEDSTDEIGIGYDNYDDESDSDDKNQIYDLVDKKLQEEVTVGVGGLNEHHILSKSGEIRQHDTIMPKKKIDGEYPLYDVTVQEGDSQMSNESTKSSRVDQLRSKLRKSQFEGTDSALEEKKEILRDEILEVVQRLALKRNGNDQGEENTTTNIQASKRQQNYVNKFVEQPIQTIANQDVEAIDDPFKDSSNSNSIMMEDASSGSMELNSPYRKSNSIPVATKVDRERAMSDPAILGKDIDNQFASPRSSSSRRRRYSAQQTLPTLDETTDKILLPSLSKALDKATLLSGESESHLGDGNLKITANSMKKNFPPSPKKSRVSKIKELQVAASDLAQRGAEDEAMKTYRKALNVAAAEMERIKAQISKSSMTTFKSRYSDNTACPLPVAAIRSIQKRIQEDLLAISDRFGKIRTFMTILHERMGEYEKAIESCKEAIDVYAHQEILQNGSDSDWRIQDKKDSTDKHGQKHKTPTDRIRDAKKMMHRLELGQSIFDQRQHAFDEMNEIRHRMSQTNDKTEVDTLLHRLYGIGFKQLHCETKALGKSHPQIVEPLLLMATLSQELNKNDEASQHLVNAYKVLRANHGMKHPKTAEVCIKTAKFHRSIQDQMSVNPNAVPSLSDKSLSYHEDMSMEYFTYATEILRASNLRPTLLGATLNDAAIIYMKRRDYSQAIELLTEALQRYEECSESLTTSVATELVARNDNSCAGENNDINETDEIGEESTTSSTSSTISASTYSEYIASTSRRSGSLSIDTLQVWRNLGEAYFQVLKFDEAMDSFANALEIQRSTRMIHDAVSELDLGIVGVEAGMMKLVDDASIVDTLCRHGKTCAAAGKYEEALKSHKESLELMNRIAIEEELFEDLSHQQVVKRRQQLSKTLYCMADACCEIDRFDDAIRYYSEAIQHSRLRAVSMDDPKFYKICRRQEAAQCASCFSGIANVYMKKEKYPEALKMLNDAIRYCEKQGLESYHTVVINLFKKKKEAEQRITELPRSNAEVAKLEARALEEMTLGNLDDAVLTLTEAMGILRSSFAQAKLAGFDSSEHLCAIARMLQTLASVFLEKGEEENAERVFMDAVRLFKDSGSEDKLEC